MVTEYAGGAVYSGSTRSLVTPFNAKERRMKANVGSIDRIIRIVAGLALVGWAATGGPAWAWIGVVPLATGIIGFCPAYTLLGMSTKK